jgi:mRNA-degrading endonuclease RelE of RelBE toxin-antitoxin system
VTWRIVWSPRALRDFGRLDPTTRERVRDALQRYVETEQGDVVRLRNVAQPEWRLRTGDYRVRFRLNFPTGSLEILRVLPRDKAYRY